jgi:hypothetical protein
MTANQSLNIQMENAVLWDMTRVALITADVSEERIAFIIRVKRFGS